MKSPSKKFKCPLCSRETTPKVLYRHFKSSHDYSSEFSEFYWEVLHPDSDRKCIKCKTFDKRLDSRGRVIRCCSDECESEILREEARVHTENGTGFRSRESNQRGHLSRVSRYPDWQKKAATAGIKKVHEMTRRLPGSYRSDHELRLGKLLEGLGLEFKVNDCRWRRRAINGVMLVPDFIVEEKLIVELDGDYHKNGLFLLNKRGRISDEDRDEALRSSGWKVLRFSNSELDESEDLVLNSIIEEINS